MENKISLPLKIILLFTIVFSFSDWKVIAASELKEIDITLSPEKILFDLANLKPGDWAERTLTVKNTGREDLKYLFSSKLKNGSQEFYNELLLKVSDNTNVLFNGKMKDFNKLDPRTISKNDAEQLNFKVTVPTKLGNDFQGLGCQVEFKFYVDGTVGGVLPVNGPKLPTTGTDMFNILVAGAVLVITGSIIQYSLSRRRRIDRRRV